MKDTLQTIGDVQSAIFGARGSLQDMPRIHDSNARYAAQRALDYLTNAREALLNAQEIMRRDELGAAVGERRDRSDDDSSL